mgnify:CR=1 FL=1
MATKFPKFSQALAQDPATRRIWYGIATAHDLEAHDGMTEENLYQKILSPERAVAGIPAADKTADPS